jgi:hypothetical protein
MTVNVSELTTEVIPEPEPPPAAASHEEPAWELVERARETSSRLVRDRVRTAAEGFDD